MNGKGYKINRRGNVARMESPTNVMNPFLEEEKCKVYIICKHCGFKLVAHGLAWETFVKETPGTFICPCGERMSINIVQTV